MSIGAIETFTTFGALDSDVMADGEPLSSYLLRTTAMNSNRLVGKGHVMAGLWWPSRDTIDLGEGDTDFNFEGTSAPSWRLIHPPITVPKKPGLSTASVRMTGGTITAGDTVRFQFVTLGTGGRVNINASVNDVNVVEHTGTGGWDSIDLDDLPISVGPYETISIYVQGMRTDRISDDATYGGPTDHDGTDVISVFPTGDYGQMSNTATPATYNVTGGGSPDLGSAGAWIVFEDQNRDPIAAPRQIICVPGATNLIFRPGLTHDEMVRANNAATGNAYTIYDAPRWAIANITIKADDR